MRRPSYPGLTRSSYVQVSTHIPALTAPQQQNLPSASVLITCFTSRLWGQRKDISRSVKKTPLFADLSMQHVSGVVKAFSGAHTITLRPLAPVMPHCLQPMGQFVPQYLAACCMGATSREACGQPITALVLSLLFISWLTIQLGDPPLQRSSYCIDCTQSHRITW